MTAFRDQSWIYHTGGECPVPLGTRLEVVLNRDSAEPVTMYAGDLLWRWCHSGDHVIRYRAATPDAQNPPTKLHILEEAKAAVADRGLNYGKPEDNFTRIARLWSAHMTNRYGSETKIDAHDVAMMMALMKIARLANSPSHMDSWVDLAGYAACGGSLPERAVLLRA